MSRGSHAHRRVVLIKLKFHFNSQFADARSKSCRKDEDEMQFYFLCTEKSPLDVKFMKMN